jgi:hypothetical protein
LLRHLKSGARGLRFEVRSSHIGPPQIGHSGIPAESTREPAAAGRAEAARAVAGEGAEPDGGAEAPEGARCAEGCAVPVPAAGVEPRGGQITPSQLRSLHLKSGAFGLRLPSRLSHIAPPHFGQSGTALDDSI